MRPRRGFSRYMLEANAASAGFGAMSRLSVAVEPRASGRLRVAEIFLSKFRISDCPRRDSDGAQSVRRRECWN